ncbi:MAG: GH3 auxin-responsive promoter family protein [Bacteroidota bacterium]
MKKLINKVMRLYLSQRYQRILHFMEHPHEVQKAVLKELIQSTKHTEWGRKYGFQSIKNQSDFAENVPIQDYESLKPYINRMMRGASDVLWSGQIKWFAKSSGTTSDKSKFIPVSKRNLKKCHIQGTWDAMTLFYHNRTDARQFEMKNLIMGGSLSDFEDYPKTKIGDVSAIMMDNMPYIGRPFFTPDVETAVMPKFDEKLERMAQVTAQEKEMVTIGGVPTWTMVYLDRILELTGKQNMMEVWPNIQVYIHGGVSFDPYREQFQKYFPSEQMQYMEIYNATEGFFAIQNDLNTRDMLLLLDNGIYYEFLPADQWEKDHPQAIPLSEVELGKNYAMVVSTNAGLWRYIPGDTVMFTSKTPYKIKITGRTKQFVNAFGEEVMVSNTDKALAQTCQAMNAIATEYTVAPIFLAKKGKGGHEWLIEFEKRPSDFRAFNKLLDENLQKINSDYEAKRYKGLALNQLTMRTLPKGTFHNWLKAKGKYGGQHKVPRLANHRKYVDEILDFSEGVSY